LYPERISLSLYRPDWRPFAQCNEPRAGDVLDERCVERGSLNPEERLVTAQDRFARSMHEPIPMQFSPLVAVLPHAKAG
jgi:hypothetical protein